MPNHPIHRKVSQTNLKAKQPKAKPRPAATSTASPATKPVVKLKSSHHGPAERIMHERPPPRRRVLEPSAVAVEEPPPPKQVSANEVWLRSNWHYFEKIRQYNAFVKGFDPPPPPSFDAKDLDPVPPPIEDASEVFQWAGVRATRGRLKEMGIPAPVVRTTSNPLFKKKKKNDLLRNSENGDNAPRPFVGEQGIPPCAGLLMYWPWRDATPLTPYYLGKKNYVMKRMLEDQELEDKKAGGDVALRTFLEPIDRDMLLPLQARVLRAYRESLKVTTEQSRGSLDHHPKKAKVHSLCH
jgi:hypothetical protein